MFVCFSDSVQVTDGGVTVVGAAQIPSTAEEQRGGEHALARAQLALFGFT